MIKVIFKCEHCDCAEGEIITWDRATEVQCDNCKKWETMKDRTEHSK